MLFPSEKVLRLFFPFFFVVADGKTSAIAAFINIFLLDLLVCLLLPRS